MNEVKKCIWIDLDNSPHVPLFNPIITELENIGYKILLTARDCFQVCELADLLELKYHKIGHHHGKNKLVKLFGLFFRAAQLAKIVIREKPVISISHGSRAQIILSNILGIPSILMDDYEPSKGVPFFVPSWIICPEVINYNFNSNKIKKYPGIKEDVYVPNFKPNESILNDLNIDKNNMIAVLRPPATEAHYHNPESEVLFDCVVNHLKNIPNLKMIILPRTKKQDLIIRNMWPDLMKNGCIVIPNKVVDGLNLIWYSDFVVSGGGTMNREAAALGIPVYSIFRGTIGDVDKYLTKTGRLILIENKKDIYKKLLIEKRINKDNVARDNTTLKSIVMHIDNIISEMI